MRQILHDIQFAHTSIDSTLTALDRTTNRKHFRAPSKTDDSSNLYTFTYSIRVFTKTLYVFPPLKNGALRSHWRLPNWRQNTLPTSLITVATRLNAVIFACQFQNIRTWFNLLFENAQQQAWGQWPPGPPPNFLRQILHDIQLVRLLFKSHKICDHSKYTTHYLRLLWQWSAHS